MQCPKELKLKVPPQEGYVMNNATLNIQTSGGKRLCRHMHVGMGERIGETLSEIMKIMRHLATHNKNEPKCCVARGKFGPSRELKWIFGIV